MKINRITPFLWYNNQAEEAAKFYCSIFKKAKIHSASPMSVTFELDGQMFYALNGGPHYTFTPAISFFITCKDQKEVDYYWNKLLKGGRPSQFVCEPAMIKRMIRNLLVNARLHGQPGAGSIRAEIKRAGTHVLIAVEDDGPGVPESERERIFAPFYRAPGPRPPGDTGLGLGLALVRQVARYHGGDVAYVARQPNGSRFEVRLPMPSS